MTSLTRNLANRYDFWISNSYKIPAEYQSIFRILYCSYVLLILGIPNWSWLGNLSDSTFSPPQFSIAALFTGFPDPAFFKILSILLSVLYVFVLFGYKTKVSSILVTIIYLLGNSFLYSRGKINHVDLLIVVTPLIMAFSSWGHHFSLDSKNTPLNKEKYQNWPVTLLTLIIGFAYFTAGLPKLIKGWLNIDTHAVKGTFFNYYYTNGYQDYLAPYLIRINNDIFWETFDWIAVVFETTFLIAIFLPSIFRFYLILAVIFHTLNYLILNIPFVENLIIYVLFINFGLFRTGIFKYKIKYIKSFFASGIALISFIIFQLIIYIQFKQSIFKIVLKSFDIRDYNIILLVAASLLTIMYIGVYIYKITLNKHYSGTGDSFTSPK